MSVHYFALQQFLALTLVKWIIVRPPACSLINIKPVGARWR